MISTESLLRLGKKAATVGRKGNKKSNKHKQNREYKFQKRLQRTHDWVKKEE